MTDSRSCLRDGGTTRERAYLEDSEACKKQKSTPMAEGGLRSQVEGWRRNHLQREGQGVSGAWGYSQCGELFLDWSLQSRKKVSGVNCEIEGKVSLVKTWAPEPV